MNNQEQINLLSNIDNPAQMRELEEAQLPILAKELREFLINTISQCGGHFAAGLLLDRRAL